MGDDVGHIGPGDSVGRCDEKGFSVMATMQGSATVGVFNTRDAADRAVDDLVRSGYSRDQIGVVAKDSSGNVTSRTADQGESGEGATIGAAAGAATAGLVSLGISFGVIPAIGPILAVGPWAAALISAASGAAAAGIAGALIGWGVPEDEANYYEGEVKSGKYVVTVKDDNRNQSWDVMQRGGAYNYANRGG